MKTPYRLILALFWCLLISSNTFAQDVPVNKTLLNARWTAQWVTCPGVSQKAYGVYHFRKTLQLKEKPEKFIVHLSADNRYRFYVNGKQVCFGPARGDQYNWYYESVDIAGFLKAGENTLAALVWNMGEYAPVAQISSQTAFVLQGDGPAEKMANTDSTWKVMANKGYEPCSLNNGERLKAYMVIGPGDHVNGALYPWNWEQAGFDDSKWPKAEKITYPEPLGYGTDNRWTMVPRNIPLMQQKIQRLAAVRRTAGITTGDSFLTGNSALTIPAGQKASILLDQSVNTLAYPQLVVSGGKGTSIKLTYAESLFKDGQKGNRNEVDGKTIAGNYDIFEPDGGSNRTFSPLWQRGYRYIQLDVITGAEPLVINDFYGIATGYPFVEKATFTSSDTSLHNIWTVGWRTARLCANELYYDCPYYEQLQYEGDTRIQSLISLYVTGDDRLMRKAINDFYNSRVPEGLTQGRYPSSRVQVIPPFSLYWVSMLYDFMMHRNDDRFLSQYLTGVQGILTWYEQRIDYKRQMLGPLKWWNFTDWSRGFPDMGVPPGAVDGNSAIITLQYAYTLRQAAALFKHFHREQEAANYLQLAERLARGTYQNCFNASKGLFADTPEKKTYSQHVNIMAVLADAVNQPKQTTIMQKVLTDTSLSQVTFYYRFYLTRALNKAGLGNLYYSQLGPWRDMLKKGLTTFAENPDPTRSDCHAWSASPDYDFLATICGITPSSAGFKTVQVKPQLGGLASISGSMPSPAGVISINAKQNGLTGIAVSVQLPPGLKGEFLWRGKILPLKPGTNTIKIN